jgi:hypothetical protein
MGDTRNILTIFVFFFGLALCFWRAPQADRWHLVLWLIAVTIWSNLLLLGPSTRNPMFGVALGTFLMLALGDTFDVERSHDHSSKPDVIGLLAS